MHRTQDTACRPTFCIIRTILRTDTACRVRTLPDDNMKDPYFADEPDPMQIEIYKNMTPQQRLRVASNLYWSARKLKAAGVRMQHPEWTDEQVQRAVRDACLYAGD